MQTSVIVWWCVPKLYKPADSLVLKITTCPLNTAELQQLREQIDPFVDYDNQGIDTFNETVNAVHRILQSWAHNVTLYMYLL